MHMSEGTVSHVTVIKLTTLHYFSGFSIVLLTVNDADGDSITLAIASGDDGAAPKFKIVDKAIQTSNSKIDYESLSGQDYGYSLTVTASDGTLTGTTTVQVTVSIAF